MEYHSMPEGNPKQQENLEVSGKRVTCDMCDANRQSLATLHLPASVGTAALLLSREPHVLPFLFKRTTQHFELSLCPLSTSTPSLLAISACSAAFAQPQLDTYCRLQFHCNKTLSPLKITKKSWKNHKNLDLLLEYKIKSISVTNHCCSHLYTSLFQPFWHNRLQFYYNKIFPPLKIANKNHKKILIAFIIIFHHSRP